MSQHVRSEMPKPKQDSSWRPSSCLFSF